MHEIWENVRDPPGLSIAFRYGYSPSILEVVQKNHQNWTVLGSDFFSRKIPKFLRQFVRTIYPYRLAKFGLVLFSELHVRSLAMKQNAAFTGGW